MTCGVLASALGFTEGPVITQGGDVVVVSIDHGRLYRVRDGKAGILGETGGGPNGSTEGLNALMYVAQNGGKPFGKPTPGIVGGVQVVSPSGAVSWLTKKPASPNDLCFGPDGFLYVTDPTRPRA